MLRDHGLPPELMLPQNRSAIMAVPLIPRGWEGPLRSDVGWSSPWLRLVFGFGVRTDPGGRARRRAAQAGSSIRRPVSVREFGHPRSRHRALGRESQALQAGTGDWCPTWFPASTTSWDYRGPSYSAGKKYGSQKSLGAVGNAKPATPLVLFGPKRSIRTGNVRHVTPHPRWS